MSKAVINSVEVEGAGGRILDHLTMDGSQPATLDYITLDQHRIAIKVSNGMKVVIDTSAEIPRVTLC